MPEGEFKQGDQVRTSALGAGTVVADMGLTVVIRFESGIQECPKSDLVPVLSPLQALRIKAWHSPLEVVLRCQAYAIRSVNDAWGVFARSRIELLPHQLWVCREVLRQWPARWLVADDVGLGKTIEAGLILSALRSRNRLRRLLIICPASLSEQWQYRLRTMFDVRTTIYSSPADTDRSDFWNTTQQVVGSLQTLRSDTSGRWARLIQGEPWDVVIVDEVHHLNADEQAGPTLGYKLVRELRDNRRVNAMVFFTGTPHRGKPFGFFALLGLLRPDLFDPRKPAADQLPMLSQVMIRNNKQNVTDLNGELLFHPPHVESRTYQYSPEESRFYQMLTEFILTGKAYASGLGQTDGRAVILVLISMQKLASSSVAAIRRALKGRLARLRGVASGGQAKDSSIQLRHLQEADEYGDDDRRSSLEEQLPEECVELRLMSDEPARLQELISAADEVREETKIKKIVETVQEYEAGRSVLFFTEYKATQSLLMSALGRKWGQGCVTFINGDEEAREVLDVDGHAQTLRLSREQAAQSFNEGRVRFLVSTEAGGEGIDLQQSCYTLIHVDLPWNPMRMHQRVGRLNRYGQRQRVEVVSIRNPETVESRIWEKLNEKIAHINIALKHVMADPEDMLQLVLGMTSESLFREIHFEGPAVDRRSFDSWFDKKTACFGSQDAVDAVKALVGHCSKFDFKQVSKRLPQVDLPDLKPFFLGMLQINRRRPQENEHGLSFKTPEEWCVEPAILDSYQDMLFEREGPGTSAERLLGVGHRLIDQSLDQASRLAVAVVRLPQSVLESSIYVFRVYDRVTATQQMRPAVIAGVQLKPHGGARVLPDWELLKLLNGFPPARLTRPDAEPFSADADSVANKVQQAESACRDYIAGLDVDFAYPEVELLSVLWSG